MPARATQGHVLLKQAAGPASKPQYIPSERNLMRQRSRMQVRIARSVKEKLKEVVIKDRKGQQSVIDEAVRLELIEAFAVLEQEPPVDHTDATITVTPTQELLDRAAFFHIPPHILVRAAAVKLGLNLVTVKGVNGGVVVGVRGEITDLPAV